MIQQSGPQPGQQVPQDTQPVRQQQANPPPATGMVAAVGRRLFGWALAHEVDPQPINGQTFKELHPECSKLIKGISDQVIRTLLVETKNSNFVQGGSQALEDAIIELAERIFISLGDQAAENQQPLSDEALVERVLVKIIKTVKEEFVREEEGITTKRRFKNIAETLFTAAFPNGVNDKGLPKLLRDDWTSKVARFGVAQGAGVDVSWSGIKSIFATYLEQTYTAFTAAKDSELGNDRLPGADAFIDAIVLKVDGAIKNMTSVSLDLPIESEEAKQFVNKALARLMQGKFTRAEDAQEVAEARAWLLDHVQKSIKALYQVLFASQEGQSSRSRLNEFADTLIQQAAHVLPQTYRQVAEINALTNNALVARLEGVIDPAFSSKIAKCSSMSEQALVKLLKDLKDDDKMLPYKDKLQEMLRELKAVRERSSNEKKPVLDKARRLLQNIGADQEALTSSLEKMKHPSPEAVVEVKKSFCTLESLHAVEHILRRELQADGIQELLPNFLPADFVFTKLYGLMAPFVADIISQSVVIAEDGKIASEEIVKLKGGAKIEGWIDKGLTWLWNDLETKATAGTLDFSKYELIDSLICHVLSPATLAKSPGVKQQLSGQIKNIINIVLKDILRMQGIDNPEKALALCVNGVIAKGQQAVTQLMKVPEGAKTIEACRTLALECNDTLKPEELEPAVLQDTYDKLSLRKSSREILEGVISQQRFNDLLPKFLKKSGFWQSGAEFLSDNVLKGLYSQAKYVQNNASGANFVLPEELKPMLKQVNDTIFKALAVREPEAGKEPQADSFDHLASELLKGPGVLDLVTTTVPKLLESAVAYHVHATETETSEQRAAALVMGFATDIQNGFDRVAAYEKERNYDLWVQSQDAEALKKYRKTHNIAPQAPIDVRAYMLGETAHGLLARLLPADLRKVLIPEQFADLLVDQVLAGVLVDVFYKSYDYSQAVTGLEKENAEIAALQKYIVGEAKDYFEKIPANEKTWTDRVALQLFAGANEKTIGFLLNFGAVGLVLKNATGAAGEPLPLLTFLSPVVAKAREVFDILSSSSLAKLQELNRALEITVADKIAYQNATKQSADEADVTQFACWVSARRCFDGISDAKWQEANPLFDKDRAATIAMKLYGAVHATLDVLLKKHNEGKAEVAKRVDPVVSDGKAEVVKGVDPIAFVDTYLVKNFKELLLELGNSPDALTKTLPTMLDTLLKQCLGDTGDIGRLRDVLVERVVYTAMGKVLTDPKSVTTKVCELVASYTTGNDEATASLLLSAVLPEEVGATALGKLLIEKAVPKGIALLIEDIRKSQAIILKKGQEAKAYVDALDNKDMQKFVHETIFAGLDSSLDALANGKEKLSEVLPVFVDDLVKDLLKDKTLMPIVKEALHNIIYIVLQQVLTPKPGQSVEARVLEVAAQLIALSNEKNPMESGAKWLKLLLPESALKELLPEFLQKAVTHEKLMEWFFEPYVGQVFATTKAMADENLKEATPNVTRAQGFAKKLLVGYAQPTADPKGLLGFAGIVREIEKKLLETLGQEGVAQVAPQMQAYLNAAVGQVTRTLETQGKLHPQFLSRALKLALPQLDPKADAPSGMPSDKEFSSKTAEELLKTLFPGGAKDLLVPEVLQDVIWQKITVGLQGVFTELTAADTRVLWVMDRLIPMTSGDDAKILARMKMVDDMRSDMKDNKLAPKDKKRAESLFKRCLVDMAVYQAGEAVKREKTPQPFKWLKGVVVKAVTHLVMRYSLSNRIYAFLADEASNERIRRLIWSLLTFKPKGAVDDKECAEELKKQLKAALHRTNIAPPIMQGAIASFAESSLSNKNIIDLLPQ